MSLKNYEQMSVILYRKWQTKPAPQIKKSKKAKWLSEETSQIAEEQREEKSKGEKERYKHLNAEFQRIASRDKKAFFNEQVLIIKETTKGERLEISSGKLETSRDHYIQRWAQ